MAKREWTDKDVRAARIFLGVVGMLILAVGWALHRGADDPTLAMVAGVAAIVGGVLAIFGMLAPRNMSVAVASTVLGLFLGVSGGSDD